MEFKSLMISFLISVTFVGTIFFSGCSVENLKDIDSDDVSVSGVKNIFEETLSGDSYLSCLEGKCIEIKGSGTDSCINDSDCYYFKCTTEGTCVKEIGFEEDECSYDTEEEDCIWCEDSDNGVNYDVKGKCRDYTGTVVEDECFMGAGGSARSRIREWQCINNTCSIDFETTFCPASECYGGICR